MARGALKGVDNVNWRGGRSVASNGYVLIRVGVDHPLADVRGYAYEHRLVAFAKLGRMLRDDEVVHHKDGNKQNNDWANVEVLTHHEHRVEHRKRDIGLRMPGEPNPRIPCACGCGEAFDRYDASGRPRSYVTGHNTQPSPTATAILLYLGKRGAAATCAEIAAAIGKGVQPVAAALSKMKSAGKVANPGRGSWRLCGGD